MNTYQQEVTSLRRRVEELECELGQYRACHRDDEIKTIMLHFRITHSLAFIVMQLATGRPLTHEAYNDAPGRTDKYFTHNLAGQIKRLRLALPWLEVKSVYAVGYLVEGEALQLLREKLEGAK
jgi:hypothetical protein